jgi:hypothetical protein
MIDDGVGLEGGDDGVAREYACSPFFPSTTMSFRVLGDTWYAYQPSYCSCPYILMGL